MAESSKRRLREDDTPLERPDEQPPTEREGSRREPKPSRPATLIALGGAKGGMGASLFCVNAAIYLAQLHHKVTLIDGDLGAANLHSLLGLNAPELTLSAFINREVERLESLKVATRIPNMELVAGASDPINSASLKHVQRQRLTAHVGQLEADYILLDVGAGLGPNNLDLFLAAKLGVLVVTPEPTAIEVTYRFLRAAFFRKLALMRWPITLERRISFLQDQATGAPGPTPRALLEETQENDPESASIIARELWRFRPAILVNQTRSHADPEVGEALRSACLRRLGVHIELLGHIEYDDQAWISVRRRRPLLREGDDSAAGRQITQAVHRILAVLKAQEQLSPEPSEPLPAQEPQNHYETLSLEPGASEEELRRAQKKMRALYADDSVGLYSAYGAQELERFQRRIAEAGEVLLDLEKRRAYDNALLPEGHPGRAWLDESRRRAALPKPAKTPPPTPAKTPAKTPTKAQPTKEERRASEAAPVPAPKASADVELSGAWLKALRESRGISLAEIATRTKIPLSSLQLVEDEAFDKMAAPVYVRGFVFEYARYLRLDAERVARVYVERYRLWLDAQAARAR